MLPILVQANFVILVQAVLQTNLLATYVNLPPVVVITDVLKQTDLL